MERFNETAPGMEGAGYETERRLASPDKLWAFAHHNAEMLGQSLEEYLLDLVEQAYARDQQFERLAETPEFQERMSRDREAFLQRVRQDQEHAEPSNEQA
jgi:hypothetical protein